jgi:hypothetical protein
MEEWKAIKGYEGIYEVSSYGRVRSLDRYVSTSIKHNEKRLVKGMYLKPHLKRNGYLSVDLKTPEKQKTVSVHRLVALAFIPLIEGKNVVNHKNLNKLDNRVENLEWVTAEENREHAKVNGAYHNNGNVIRIRCCETGQEFESSYKAAEWLNKTKFQYSKQINHMAQNIRAVCLGYRRSAFGFHWKNVI